MTVFFLCRMGVRRESASQRTPLFREWRTASKTIEKGLISRRLPIAKPDSPRAPEVRAGKNPP
jgi:hypothetical protein